MYRSPNNTFAYLADIPEEEDQRKLTALWNYEKYPSLSRMRPLFSSKIPAAQTKRLYTAPPAVEAKTLSIRHALERGSVALTGIDVTGTATARIESQARSDCQNWKVRDVDTGKIDGLVQW